MDAGLPTQGPNQLWWSFFWLVQVKQLRENNKHHENRDLKMKTEGNNTHIFLCLLKPCIIPRNKVPGKISLSCSASDLGKGASFYNMAITRASWHVTHKTGSGSSVDLSLLVLVPAPVSVNNTCQHWINIFEMTATYAFWEAFRTKRHPHFQSVFIAEQILTVTWTWHLAFWRQPQRVFNPKFPMLSAQDG